MRFEDPVADVDHVDVLLHDDVTGEHAVAYPVPQPALGRRGVGPGGAIDVPGEVVGFTADDVAQRALVDAAHQLDEGRAVADLESHVQTHLALGAFANLDDTFRAGDVDRHRLLQIHVLAGGNGGFEVLRMEVGWRRDDNRVHLLGGSESLVGARADEELLRIQRREPFRLLHLIEMRARGVELVWEQVGQRYDASAAGVHQIRRVFRAATPAAEQADADGRIGARAMHQFRLDKHGRRGGSRRAHERPPVECVSIA